MHRFPLPERGLTRSVSLYEQAAFACARSPWTGPQIDPSVRSRTPYPNRRFQRFHPRKNFPPLDWPPLHLPPPVKNIPSTAPPAGHSVPPPRPPECTLSQNLVCLSRPLKPPVLWITGHFPCKHHIFHMYTLKRTLLWRPRFSAYITSIHLFINQLANHHRGVSPPWLPQFRGKSFYHNLSSAKNRTFVPCEVTFVVADIPNLGYPCVA